MRDKRVLVINQYFPPDTAATAKVIAQLVTYLSRHFTVTVLAGRPSYNPTEHHPCYFSRREWFGAVRVERVGSTVLPRYRMRWRLSNYLSYLALALPKALTLPADVLIAMTDPPLACLVGALVARWRRLPFIYNIRDLHPDMAIAAGLLPSCWWTEKWDRLNQWAMRQADWVVVLGEDMRERVRAKGVLPSKIVVIRDGVPIPESLPSPDHPIAHQLRGGFPFVAMHAGNLGFYGAWETLIAAARQVSAEGIGLIFVGDGACKESLRLLVDGIENVQFLPFRPPQEVPFVLAAPDLHIVTLKRGMEGLVVPSKLYPILAAGKPVLVVAPESSDPARIVQQAGCGLVADPDDPTTVTAMLRWARQNPDALQRMGQRAREIAPEFSADRHFQKFAELIAQTIA
jgi:glycosyltransferase involved in cell wall biosynthesis